MKALLLLLPLVCCMRTGAFLRGGLIRQPLLAARAPLEARRQQTCLQLFKPQPWSPGTSIKPRKDPDFLAILNYLSATTVQLSLIVSFMHLLQLCGLNQLPDIFGLSANLSLTKREISNGIVAFFMLFMSLRSRVFSPLNNSRPSASKNDPIFKNRLRPWWQPPPLAFPIIWSSIALLRTISTTLIFDHSGTLLTKPIFALMLHLSIGDTWNTINNVEARLGTSAVAVFFVLGSALYATKGYYDVLPLAAKVLAPSCVWLSVATLLVVSIYRLNYVLFNKPSLFPSIQEGPRSSWKLPLTSFTK